MYEDRDTAKRVFQGDLFHLLMRLVSGITRAERKAYAAIKKEYEAAEKCERATRERVLLARLAAYDAAHAEAEQWMRWYDESRYLFRELQEVLRIVDMKTGELRHTPTVRAEVETILVLFEQEIPEERIQKGARFIRDHQNALLHYFDEVEVADERLKTAIADSDVRQCLFRFYASHQQLIGVYGRHKRYLDAQLAIWRASLITQIGEAEFERVWQLVKETLDPIIRSSSMVENTNSRLRRFFDSARGQINQNRLNLLRFYLNHKPFERGRRQGNTAAQLFHNEHASPEHWLTILRAQKTEKTATV